MQVKIIWILSFLLTVFRQIPDDETTEVSEATEADATDVSEASDLDNKKKVQYFNLFTAVYKKIYNDMITFYLEAMFIRMHNT